MAAWTNLLLQAANVGTASSPWVGDTEWESITEVPSIIPGQSAWAHKNEGLAASRARSQIVGTLTANPHTVVAVLATGDAATSSVGVLDSTAGAWVVRVDYTWATGSAVVGASTGGSGATAGSVLLSSGLALVWGTGTPNNVGNTRRPYIYPTGTGTNTDTAIIHYTGLFEDDFFGAVIPTAATAVTRAAEELYYVWALGPSKGLAAYVRFVAPAAGAPSLFRIGGSAPSLDLGVTAGEIRATHNNNSSTVTSTTSGASWSHGDEVEARLRYGSDGKVTAAVSVAGGTEVVGTQSAALSPASLWGNGRIYVGGLASEMASVSIREIKVASDPDATMDELRAL
jgi:hypothetical protein